jgi:hypothetical protein
VHAAPGIILTEMATLASGKSNVVKSIIPVVKKCLWPAGRPGDSAASAMRRSLSTNALKYRPEEDSSIEDGRQRRQASEIRGGGLSNVFDGELCTDTRIPWPFVVMSLLISEPLF